MSEFTRWDVAWRAEFNSDADVFYDRALGFSSMGHFPQADVAFSEAQRTLNKSNGEFGGCQTEDAYIMQSGLITRDRGWLEVKKMHQDDPFIAASATVVASSLLEKSVRILSQNVPLPGQKILRKDKDRDARSELGLARSYVGRCALSKMVLYEEIKEQKPLPEQSHQLRQDMQSLVNKYQAYNNLKRGSSKYYAVSHSMHAARANYLIASNKRELRHVLPWLGRAASNLAIGMVFDRHSTGKSLKEIKDIGRTMFGRTLALDGVRYNP